MLTYRQKQIKDFVAKAISKNGVAPSEREIAGRFRISPSTAHEHLATLQNKGYMEKDPGRARGIRIINTSTKLIRVPLRGIIAAGEPIRVFEKEKESIAVPKSKLPKSGGVYALRVSGNSMIDENIKDGDYEPIIITKDREIAIQGILIDVIQNEREPVTDKHFPVAMSKKEGRLPLNKIILGDALAELRKLPNDSCDVIIADPPYNIGKDFGNNIDKRDLRDYVAWCKEWINECIRIMKPTGTMFIYGFSEILAHLSVEIPINKRWLIWHYTNKNVASLNFWQRSHEAIICAWKDKPIFNRDEVREPYTEGFLNGAAGKVRKGTPGRFSGSGAETIYNAHEGGALPRDVIKIPALAGGAGMVERWFLCKKCNNVFEPRQLTKHNKHEIIKHPTQKPFELSRKLILSAAPKKNGVVLAPFVGTGSECAAAKKLNQNYIGFEINPDYVRIAEKFISSVKITSKL